MTRRQFRLLTRDTLIVLVALGLLIYEVGWGGARPPVLLLLGGLLGLPAALRVDEARRIEKKEPSDGV